MVREVFRNHWSCVIAVLITTLRNINFLKYHLLCYHNWENYKRLAYPSSIGGGLLLGLKWAECKGGHSPLSNAKELYIDNRCMPSWHIVVLGHISNITFFLSRRTKPVYPSVFVWSCSYPNLDHHAIPTVWMWKIHILNVYNYFSTYTTYLCIFKHFAWSSEIKLVNGCCS
jgi:hypothetical protein